MDPAVRGFALLQIVVGLLGFTGPAVRGNEDCIVNLRPGRLCRAGARRH